MLPVVNRGIAWGRASGSRAVRHESCVLVTGKHMAMGINISIQRGRLAGAGSVDT